MSEGGKFRLAYHNFPCFNFCFCFLFLISPSTVIFLIYIYIFNDNVLSEIIIFTSGSAEKQIITIEKKFIPLEICDPGFFPTLRFQKTLHNQSGAEKKPQIHPHFLEDIENFSRDPFFVSV